MNSGAPDTEDWALLASSTNGGNLVAAFYDGGIYTSTNWADSWSPSLAQSNTWSCLASSADGSHLVAGTSPGVLFTSQDGGATFRSRLPENQDYQAIASSSDGQTLVCAVDGPKRRRRGIFVEPDHKNKPSPIRGGIVETWFREQSQQCLIKGLELNAGPCRPPIKTPASGTAHPAKSAPVSRDSPQSVATAGSPPDARFPADCTGGSDAPDTNAAARHS